MSGSVFFLFPGQGAQYPGMGLDLAGASAAAKKVFDTASKMCGKDMIALVRDSDAETLKRSDISQPAISCVSLAAACLLEERGIKPAAAAGFSLGEYPALAAAGVISMEDCFRLVTARGRAMQKAVDRMAGTDNAANLRLGGMRPSGPRTEGNGFGGMAAVVGLAPDRAEELIAQWTAEGLPGLYPANINSPRQIVVSGTAAALDEAEKRFKEAGARRFLRLAVAGPFHSPLMQEAADEFGPALEAVRFANPRCPLFSNVSGGEIKSGAEAKALALRHIVEGVRWTAEEAAMAALSPGMVLETGPGKVLQGLWRDTGTEIPAAGAGTLEEIDSLTKE